jgi:hypothetical protein
VLAGSLGLFRTIEHVRERLDHFDAYLFLYAFNLNHLLVFVVFQSVLFSSFQALHVSPMVQYGYGYA